MMGLRGDRPGALLLAMALAVLIIVAAIASTDSGIRRSVVDLFGYGGPHSDESSGSRTLFHSGAPIGGSKNGETYAAYDARRRATGTAGFRGFACPGDCSRLEAGYRWAEERRAASARACRGPSWEFVEGCVAFVWEVGGGGAD